MAKITTKIMLRLAFSMPFYMLTTAMQPYCRAREECGTVENNNLPKNKLEERRTEKTVPSINATGVI